jgi:RHS repeat-associated protein
MSDPVDRILSKTVITVAASFVLATLFSLFAIGQVQQQVIPSFSTVETHEYDTINLATLGIKLNVPVRSKAGHIPFSFNLMGASQVTVATIPNGQGFRTLFEDTTQLVGHESHLGWGAPRWTVQTKTSCNTTVEYTGWTYKDAAGNNHLFPSIIVYNAGNTCSLPTSGGGYAMVGPDVGAYDGSGLYLHVDMVTNIYSVTDVDGNTYVANMVSDPNGNAISTSYNASTGVTTYTDTLGQPVMASSAPSGSYQEVDTWTDALGGSQSVKVINTSFPDWLAFGCSSDQTAVSSFPFTTSVTFPDNSTVGLSWEKNQMNATYYTGRLASLSLPSGGTINYAYSGGTHGINCSDGTPATMTRTTPDGTWTYTHVSPVSGVDLTTTVVDPKGNNSVYTFADHVSNLEIEKQIYNGSVTPSNLVQTVVTCYNTANSNPTTCNASHSYVALPVTEKDVYTSYPGVAGYSAVKTLYDTFGRVLDVQTFDFNAASPTNEKIIAYGSGNPSTQTCTAISTYVIGKPCSSTLKDGSGNVLSQTWNAYDSNGNLTQSWNLVSGSGSTGNYLTKQYTYDSHGVVQTMTDVNGQVMNYTTTSCNNMFVTSQYPTNFSNLQTSQTWDCNGGVVTSATDANSQTTQTLFFVNSLTDPFYRPVEDKDQLGNVTSFTYTPTSTESVFLFNSNNSVIDTLSTTDSIGRPVVSQLRQGPNNANWDTKSRSFDSDGRPYETSLACVKTAGNPCPASTESQTYDALNRPLVHTDTGSPAGVVTKTYYANDVRSTLTPAPSGENAKAVQKESDGLGRLKSTCLISSATGNGLCGQANGGSGFLTTYSYDGAGRLLQTVENAQVSSPQQKRTYSYDLLGRLNSETNPEWSGTQKKTYSWDTVNNAGICVVTSNGDLLQEIDPNGNTTCHHYDGLHRETYTTYSGPNSNNVSKYFVYDSATVNGTAMSYAEGRMAEAYTCSGSNAPPCSPKITDEGFSYDQRGQLHDYYQSSPNSGGYYHLSATHWEDKSLKTVSGVGLPTVYYGASDGTGLDGEGRVTKVNASTGTNPVSGVTYVTSGTTQPIGSLQSVTLGAGDSQSFTYDVNTSRMTQYSASVGATPTVISGSLSWSPNGTLQQLSISDGYNSADTQVCSYLYDDFVRVAGILNSTPGVNCLNGSTKVWNQTFTYGTDAFGNLTKSSSGPGSAWNPGYNAANNHYTLGGTSYDSNGNLLADTFHSYTWLADGHVATVVTGSTTASVTYDAMGNKVEENIGGTIHEYPSAFGVTAQMTGQTENATNVDLPGGVQALYSGGTLQRLRFPDWQGTIRAEFNPTTRAFTESLAFAPFGERYSLKGAPFNVDSFTGKPDQLVSDEYDFEARELHNGQGRWVSPDPTRGTGNKYVYADNNPLSKVDLYGLLAMEINGLSVYSDDVSVEGGVNTLSESHAPTSTQTNGASVQFGGVGQCFICDDVAEAEAQSAMQEQINALTEPLNPFSMMLGAAKEMTVNAFVDFATMVDRMRQMSSGGPDLHVEDHRLSPANISEAAGMFSGATLSFLIPGPEELKGASVVERIFENPGILPKLSTEAHAAELGRFLEQEGWQVSALGKGSHAGQGMRALELNAEGKMTGRAISWHPGSGHHGPSPYWKVSSPEGGIVRIGPQFLP